MPFFDNLTDDEKRDSAKSPVWPVHALSDKQTRSLGDPRITRMPRQFNKVVLDFDAGRQRSGDLEGKGRTEYVRKFLKGLAVVGIPLWEPSQDPLFWCIRVGNDQSPPPLPHRDLQRDPQLLARNRIITALEGVTPSTAQYRSMAAWACRRLAPHPSIRAVLSEICNENRGGIRRVPAPRISCQTAPSWLKWVGIAHRGTFPLPIAGHRFQGSDSTEWRKLGLRPDDAVTLLALVRQYERFHESQSKQANKGEDNFGSDERFGKRLGQTRFLFEEGT